MIQHTQQAYPQPPTPGLRGSVTAVGNGFTDLRIYPPLPRIPPPLAGRPADAHPGIKSSPGYVISA